MQKRTFNKTEQKELEKLQVIYESLPIAICLSCVKNSVMVLANSRFEKLIGSKINPNKLQTLESFNSLDSKELSSQISAFTRSKAEKKNAIPLTASVFNNLEGTISFLKIKIGKKHYIQSAISLFLDTQPTNKFTENENKKAKQTQELISKNKQLLEAQTLGHIGSWDWNFATDTIFWTDEMYCIYGLMPQKIKIDSSNFLMGIHPEDIKKVTTEIETTIKTHKPLQCFYRIIRPDKSIRNISSAGKVYVDKDNKIIKMAGIAKDITDKKQAVKLAYSKSLIEASRDALFTITNDGTITETNNAALLITNKIESEVTGSAFASYFSQAAKAKQLCKDIFKKGMVNDVLLHAKSKKTIDLLFNGVVYKNNDDKIVGAVLIARDITAQNILEKELVEAKTFAELATSIAEEARNSAMDAVKSKQQFLSNMSHEIRTPMNAIIGFTKVILKTELSAKQKEYLMAIKMSGDAMIVLINDILDLAKVDAGMMNFEKIPFKLGSSITSMLHLFETKIQEKNLQLITKYDTKIPDFLVGDPVRLHQIILNLVSNAVKFTNEGKITVTVKLLSQDDKNTIIEFTVQDTGIGIKASKIDSIFENFQQATSTTSRLYGGTGLGLAIVKQLVEAQGGTIKIKSTLNEGSSFSFALAFEKTTIDAIREPEIVELDSTKKNTSVLVVEDMELNQLLMKTLLDDFGFDCDITANGKLAVEKLETKQYDIILMDLQMPIMNGFEATEYIRKTLKLNLPIIALTADVTAVDVEKCREVGMNDYIAKPVDERLLYSKLISFSKKPVLIIEHTKGQNVAKDTIRYVDMSYLTTLTKANPKLMSEMITAYLQQTPPLIRAMKKSLVDKNWKMLQSVVHKMIPSFTIIGLHPATHEIAKKIQEYAFSLEISEEIHKLILELEKICKQSIKELEIELHNLKK